MRNNYQEYFNGALTASRHMHSISEKQQQLVFHALADSLLLNTDKVLEANKRDLERMSIDDPKYDRLQLTLQRLENIASDIRNVAALKCPVGKIISNDKLPNGLSLTKVRVPLGVIGVIYEARPNVTLDVFSLCFRTGNVAVLKGGSDAEFSNIVLIELIHEVLKRNNLDTNIAVLLPAEREATASLLNAQGFVDVIIPRGSQALIDYVREHSKIPVIETGAGIVHTFFDTSGDLSKGQSIILNAKTRRVSVCNALDCLLVHEARLMDLNHLVGPLREKGVVIFADERAYTSLHGSYPEDLLKSANPEDFGTEFLDYKMAIKTVNNLDDAISHIARYSSKHSEAIIAEDEQVQERFIAAVDAAAVYTNASTAFTDGAEFGLGAEIGISTQKLHARGPMGLEELTSYKWVVRGDGHVR